MNHLEDMERMAADGSLRLRVNPDRLKRGPVPARDSIFQVPLLGLTILSLARNSQDPIATVELTRWTLAALARQYPTIRISGKRMAWSVTLRKHCAEAILFLERIGLVEVQESPTRNIKTTKEGVAFLRNLRNRGEESGFLARSLDHSASAALQGGLDLL